MNPQSIEWWSTILTSVAVWTGVIATGSGVAAFLFTKWDANNKTRELERFKVESSERTATLERETADAKLELEKIKERQKPRTLTQEWQTLAASELSKFQGQSGTVIASPSTPESEMLARTLAAPLREAGWDISIMPGTATATVLYPKGVVIGYRDSVSDDAANRLVELLAEINISATAVPNPSVRSDDATIKITISER